MRRITILMLACIVLLLASCAAPDSLGDAFESGAQREDTEPIVHESTQPQSETGEEKQAGNFPEENNSSNSPAIEDASSALSSAGPGTGSPPSASAEFSTKPPQPPKSDPKTSKESPPATGAPQPPQAEVSTAPSTEPAPESSAAPEPEPEKEPTSSEPTFDVNDWISFATCYGQSVGLTYDSTATDCWDNPIIASAKSLYLERDIKSRLDLYAADGMTYFCVWAQLRADGRYDLYIGYA